MIRTHNLFPLRWERLSGDFWPAVFANDNPVAIEIGPGLGEFLETIALREPNWNFFAVERSHSHARTIQQRIDRKQLSNARVIRCEAEFVLALLPDNCVDGYYIQFPDPWWKRRHHRRRLMTPAVVSQLHRTLRPGRCIEFITDVEEYFALAFGALDAEPGLEHIPTDPDLLTATSFSRKAAARGWKLSASTHRKLAGEA